MGSGSRPSLQPELPHLIARMLAILRDDVLPLTEAGVRAGNKVFGAAVLRKRDLGLVVVGTNEETRNPLLHGEMSCLNRYWALPRDETPPPAECLFLSTHEPCSLCLSAITWSGFDNFYYLFSYEDTRDEFEIPHDLAILAEVFRCPNGEYAPRNTYWTSYYLNDLIDATPGGFRHALRKEVTALADAYAKLSDEYQRRKQEGDIPLR